MTTDQSEAIQKRGPRSISLRRLLFGILVIGACFLILVIRSPIDPLETEYNGRLLEEWHQDLASNNPETRRTAEQTLMQIGTNLTPGIIASVKSTNWVFLDRAIGSISKHGFTISPWGSQVEKDRRAWNLMRSLGPGAKAVIPSLLKLVDDPHLADRASWMIEGAGMDSIAEQITLVDHTNTVVRHGAINNISWAILEARWRGSLTAEQTNLETAAVEAVLRHLHDPDPSVQWLAMVSASYFKTRGKEVAPKLIAALEDPQADALTSINCLGRLHSEPELVLPVLTNLLAHTNQFYREYAMVALGKYGADAEPALPGVLRALADPDLNTRWEATNSLAKIDPDGARRAKLLPTGPTPVQKGSSGEP